MVPMTSVVRRLGLTPQQRGSVSNISCPDVFELDDGRFAVIGTATEDAAALLPAGVEVPPGETMVVLDRATVVAARADIPDG